MKVWITQEAMQILGSTGLVSEDNTRETSVNMDKGRSGGLGLLDNSLALFAHTREESSAFASPPFSSPLDLVNCPF